jgi:hypothetical protein
MSQASSITFSHLFAPLLIDKPWFLTEGKALLLCSSHLPLGVPQLTGYNHHHQLHASHHSPHQMHPSPHHQQWPAAALGVFLGIHVNTKDFCKIRNNSYDFGKNSNDFYRMNTMLVK